MRIALASDHAGFRYKNEIKKFLQEKGHQCVDFGTGSEKPADYPPLIRPAAQAVASGQCDRAVVLGGSGNGEAIVSNRIKGVRCTVAWSRETARLARAHNDSNVLAIGQRMMPLDRALKLVEIWLETPFDGGRHERRINMIDS